MQSTRKESCSGGRLVVVVGVFWLRTETVNVTASPPTTTPGLSFVLRIDGFGWRTLTVYAAETAGIAEPPGPSTPVKRAVLVRLMAFCAVVSAPLVTRAVAVTRKRCGDAVLLSNVPLNDTAPFAGFSTTLPGTGEGDEQTGSGSEPVGVGATGQNSRVGAGEDCRTKPAGRVSTSEASKIEVPAGIVTA